MRIYIRLAIGLNLAAGLILGGCSTIEPAVKVEFREVVKEVQRPCPVTKPVTPTPLARPLPEDPARLIDLLVAKLLEYAGPGGYSERAGAAIDLCTKP